MKIKKWLILIPILLIASVGIRIGLGYLTNIDVAVSTAPEDNHTKMVEIPEGSSTQDIATILEEEGIIDSAFKFRVFSRLNDYDGRFMAGSYPLAPTMDLTEICDMLCTGLTSQTSFTIPEGYTIDQIADTLAKEGLVDRDEFIRQTQEGDYSEYAFLSSAPEGRHRLEGYLFPETYVIPTNADADMIIRTMLDQFEVVWSKYEAQAAQQNQTVHEVITLASLIEKEAILDEDRKLVSSVIHNRLDIDMPLQIDAAIHFALELEGKNHTYLTYDDLEIDSPYNLYQHYGLPPTPIACPGEACINAALNPEDTEYIYYVLVDDNEAKMAFSTNYEDFITDAEHWASTIEEGAEEADWASLEEDSEEDYDGEDYDEESGEDE
ncbi:MAG: endolytic transglycosylase MltG [Firmicutes bacterium]|nr:endolytic transglycosylase MltG [Bacillota bacterium]